MRDFENLDMLVLFVMDVGLFFNMKMFFFDIYMQLNYGGWLCEIIVCDLFIVMILVGVNMSLILGGVWEFYWYQ